MRPIRTVVVWLLVAPAIQAAVPLRVVGRGVVLTSCDGSVKARQLCDTAACPTRNVPLSSLSKAPYVLELPSGQWKIVVDSSRCWAPDITVNTAVSNELLVWPAARIDGTVEPPTAGSLRAEYRLAGETGEHGPQRYSVDCPIANGHWSCRAPASVLDLRMSLDRHAPRYFHGVSIDAGEEKNFAAVRFEQGASLAGLVTPADRHNETAVELTDESAALASSGQRSGPPSRRIVVSNSNGGFFQFTGLRSGVYRVNVIRHGWLSAEARSIRVDKERETLLDSPLRLERAAVVDVFIAPPLSTQGEPWRVKLQRAGAIVPAEPVAESEASFSGEWRSDALHAGKYLLSVEDRHGSTFLRETIEAGLDAPPRFLSILKIHVSGVVRMGATPFESRLIFTDDDGSASVALLSDATGKIDGILPHEGRWRVQVRNAKSTFYVANVPVEVKRISEQAVATIAVTLPGGKVRGHVTDEAGAPVDADVAVFRNGRVIGDGLVLPDGSFEVSGLEPGPVALQALTRGAESDEVSYLATEDDPASVQLVLRKLVDVECQLFAEDGSPIAGAVIRYAGAGIERGRQIISAPTGEFSIHVPKSARSLLVAIVAPELPVAVRILNLEDSRRQRIIVGAATATLHIVHPLGTLWPFVTLDGQAFLSVVYLLAPTADGLRGFVDDGLQVQVEPGVYTICYAKKSDGSCQSVNATAGREQTLFPDDGKAK
jgi:hypothetical protein